jgi:hypothetical protein
MREFPVPNSLDPPHLFSSTSDLVSGYFSHFNTEDLPLSCNVKNLAKSCTSVRLRCIIIATCRLDGLCWDPSNYLKFGGFANGSSDGIFFAVFY